MNRSQANRTLIIHGRVLTGDLDTCVICDAHRNDGGWLIHAPDCPVFSASPWLYSLLTIERLTAEDIAVKAVDERERLSALYMQEADDHLVTSSKLGLAMQALDEIWDEAANMYDVMEIIRAWRATNGREVERESSE